MKKHYRWIGAVITLGVVEVLILCLGDLKPRAAPALDDARRAVESAPLSPPLATTSEVRQAPASRRPARLPTRDHSIDGHGMYPPLLQAYLDLTDWAEDPGGEILRDAIKLLEGDPELRARLLQSLSETRGSNPALHWRKLKLLAAVDADDIEAHARNLLTNGNASVRADGYDLMRMDASEDSLEHVLSGVRNENDPAALLSATSALQAHTAIPPQQAVELSARLRSLAVHDDPRLRITSLGALAALGKGEGVAETLASALVDNNPEVVDAALNAIGNSSARTAPLKSNLLDFALAPGTSPEQRAFAARLLTKFELSGAEYDSLASLAPLGADPMPPPR